MICSTRHETRLQIRGRGGLTWQQRLRKAATTSGFSAIARGSSIDRSGLHEHEKQDMRTSDVSIGSQDNLKTPLDRAAQSCQVRV